MQVFLSPATTNLLFLAVMVALMCFIFYQNIRQQREQKKFAESLQKGDKVVMKSGLHGRIAELTEDAIVIETMAGKLKFERTAVSLEYTKRVQKAN